VVSGVLEDEGYQVRTAADSTATLAAIEDRRPSLVLLDVWLQGSRLTLIAAGHHAARPTLGADDLGHGNLDTAVAAIRQGASRLHREPFEAERLLPGRPATETDRLRARMRPSPAGRPGRQLTGAVRGDQHGRD
jgi:two-component system nitrogen regulation response regulator NtrX